MNRRYLIPVIGAAALALVATGVVLSRGGRGGAPAQTSAAPEGAEATTAPGGEASPASGGDIPTVPKPIPAPAFQVKTLEGKTIDPAAQHGKVVILDFWATWCGPCKMTIPDLQRMHEKYGEQGLVIIGVSPEDKKTVQAFAKEQGMSYTLAADLEGVKDGAGKYEVTGFPTMVVIDRKGFVQDYQEGVDPNHWPDRIEKIVQRLLAEPA